ncbi:MAG TPA: hypothetical protein VI756_11430 [Blastocatellia bacterium]
MSPPKNPAVIAAHGLKKAPFVELDRDLIDTRHSQVFATGFV